MKRSLSAWSPKKWDPSLTLPLSQQPHSTDCVIPGLWEDPSASLVSTKTAQQAVGRALRLLLVSRAVEPNTMA